LPPPVIQALHIEGLPLATALVDAALLRERLGLYEDAASLGEYSCQVLARWSADLGLNEAKDSPELVNLYMQVGASGGEGGLGVEAGRGWGAEHHIQVTIGWNYLASRPVQPYASRVKSICMADHI
jgi:hypothetical protein